MTETRYALLVGIDKYKRDQITTLLGAVNDVKGVGNALVKYAGFERENVFQLTSDAVKEDEKPEKGI